MLPPRPLLGALAVAVALIIGPAATLAAPRDLPAEARRVIDDLDLQRELPMTPVERPPPPRPEPAKFPPELVWGVLMVGGLLMVAIFAPEIIAALPMSRRRAEAAAAAASQAAATAVPPEVLAAPDELAQQGRFVEAMHALLLRALTEVRQRLGERFADSLTSREILRHTRLSPDGRGPLRELVTRVELSYFGDHPVGADDYQACRDCFRALADAIGRTRPGGQAA